MLININKKNILSKKIQQYLGKTSGKVLLIFNHGLGDFINFLPIYEELKRLNPTITFNIGYTADRDFKVLHRDCMPINLTNFRNDLNKRYTYIFKIDYPEPTDEEKNKGKAKPYCCMEQEIGINYKWQPYQYNFKPNNESKLIGIHFTGNTNHNLKNPKFDRIQVIWEEIKALGYTPFECHMNHNYQTETNYPEFINPNNSLRFTKPSMCLLLNKIKECKYFIGVDSGPLYLAGSILGLNNIIGLQAYFNISWYLPEKIDIIDTIFYKHGSITNLIKEKDSVKR